jgi:hypothetical protein
MSAMHHDSSADLNVVKTKLKEILEVHEIYFFVPINVSKKAFFSVYIMTSEFLKVDMVNFHPLNSVPFCFFNCIRYLIPP